MGQQSWDAEKEVTRTACLGSPRGSPQPMFKDLCPLPKAGFPPVLFLKRSSLTPQRVPSAPSTSLPKSPNHELAREEERGRKAEGNSSLQFYKPALPSPIPKSRAMTIPSPVTPPHPRILRGLDTEKMEGPQPLCGGPRPRLPWPRGNSDYLPTPGCFPPEPVRSRCTASPPPALLLRPTPTQSDVCSTKQEDSIQKEGIPTKLSRGC